MAQIGRNDPCPCGSGKKYKHCCLPRQSGVDSQITRWREAEGRLLGRLTRYTQTSSTGKTIAHAFGLFFGEEDAKGIEGADERFLDWLTFDYRHSVRSRRLIEKFQAEEGPRLSEDERHLLADWLDSYLGIFEVTAVYPGRGLDLTDIFTKDRFAVTEFTASRRLAKYDLVYVRLLKVFETHTLGNAPMIIPRPWRPSLQDWFARERERYSEAHPGASHPEFMRARAFSLHRLIVGRWLHPVFPKVMLGEGEELLFSTAVFRLADREGVIEALSGSEDFSPPEEGGPGETVFAWYQRPSGSDREQTDQGPGFRRTLGIVKLRGDTLILESQSRKRLNRGKALLAALVGDKIAHKADSFVDPVQAVTKGSPRPAGRSMQPPELPPEIQQQIIGQYLDKHYRDWVDQPLPALGGRTPREAWATVGGRDAVEDILRDIENAEEHKRLAGEPYYDASKVRLWLEGKS